MKVTLKNTRILFYLSIANILVCVLIFLFLLTGIRAIFTELLLAEYCLFFIAALFYFIRILLHFNEATAVVAAYTMLTCILAISCFDIVFPRLLDFYASWLGVLTEVISLLVAFRSFTIKAPAVSLAFKIFGGGVGLAALPRLVVPLVYSRMNDAVISITGGIGILVILLATSFILKRMMDYQSNNPAPAEAIEEQD